MKVCQILLNSSFKIVSISRITVIFNVYSSDGTSVTKESLENVILASEGSVPAVVSECFSQVSIRLR